MHARTGFKNNIRTWYNRNITLLQEPRLVTDMATHHDLLTILTVDETATRHHFTKDSTTQKHNHTKPTLVARLGSKTLLDETLRDETQTKLV